MTTRRAFTLVETLMGMVFLTAISGLVAALFVDTTRVSGRIGTGSDLQRQARYALDLMGRDVQGASSVLPGATVGGDTYTTDGSTTLVLQLPASDSSGAILPGTDTVIFSLRGSTLHRVVSATTGSVRAPSRDDDLGSSFTSLAIDLRIDDMLTGDGLTATFGLSAPAYVGGGQSTQTVTAAGTSLTVGDGGDATYSGSSLVFGTAPASGTALDALYSIDPSSSATAATAVFVDLTVGDGSSSTAYGASAPFEVSSQWSLRNR